MTREIIGSNMQTFLELIRLLGFTFQRGYVCCGGKRTHVYSHVTGLTIKVRIKAETAILKLRNAVLAPAFDIKKIHDEKTNVENIIREKIQERPFK